jgi:putative ABC transport system permease protein
MKISFTKTTPPRWATRLLRWYCAPHRIEEVEGDLREEFEYQLQQAGLRKAQLDYIRSVFGFIRPFALKRKSTKHNPLLPMNLFKHYFTVAIRQVWRHKAFSAINVIGLTLGITCCMMIYLWVTDEYSVDNFHTKSDRLYNIYMTTVSKTGVQGMYNIPRTYDENKLYVLFEDAKDIIPEVEGIAFYHAGYAMPWGKPETFKVGDKVHKLEGSRANQDFFDMFSFPVIAGDPATALKDISSIAISRKMSDLFFENPQTAIGQSIRYENKLDFQITAVFEDLTPHTSLKFDFLANWAAHVAFKMDWASNTVNGTLLLAPGADIATVTEKLNRHASSKLPKLDGVTTTFGLQPYRDQYLQANFTNGKPSGGRIEYVRIFSGVAVFILVIACVNFMNLATARSIKRAKEVGVRKVVGSTRWYLIAQFFGEALLLSFFGLILSLILLQLLLPLFNNYTGKQIVAPLGDLTLWTKLIGLTLITGIVAGSYPALFLSSLKPVKVLKGVVSFTPSAIWMRKGMAIFQFGLSILLLVATMVMSEQTRFMQHVNLGYNKENLVYFSMEGELVTYDKYLAFKEAALKRPGVLMVDRSSEAPHSMGFLVDEDDGIAETNKADDSAIKWEGKQKGDKVGFKPTSVGFDFVGLMNLEIIEGRNFSRDHATDSADAFLVNEQAVKEMGMKDPIGKWVSAWQKRGHIIGVLKNYNTNSLHERIRPLIVDVKEYENFGVIMIRTEPGKTKQALASLEKLYKEFNPNYPFVFRFVNEDYNKMYKSEQMMTKLSNTFAALAITISCLGLLGLIMFSAEQRTREIGIRKALGATVSNIVRLLSKDSITIILVSFCIAAPVAAYLMGEWLNGFAYKIGLSWWIFASAGLAALSVALLTISFQAIQSARANPVDSLRSE